MSPVRHGMEEMQVVETVTKQSAQSHSPNYRLSFQLLRTTLGLLILVTGVDKFFNLLTNWERLLTPAVSQVLHMSALHLMHIAGVGEIMLGCLIFVKPRLGLPLAAGLFISLVINLLTLPGELHLAVLDLSFFVCTIAAIILDLPTAEQKIG